MGGCVRASTPFIATYLTQLWAQFFHHRGSERRHIHSLRPICLLWDRIFSVEVKAERTRGRCEAGGFTLLRVVSGTRRDFTRSGLDPFPGHSPREGQGAWRVWGREI